MKYQPTPDPSLLPVPPGGRTDHNGEKYCVVMELYEAYRIYCDQRGEQPQTFRVFCKKMRTIVPDFERRYKQKVIGGKRHWVITNMGMHTQQVY